MLKKDLDTADIVREGCYQQLSLIHDAELQIRPRDFDDYVLLTFN